MRPPRFWLGLGLGALLGWTLAQQGWVLVQVGRRNAFASLRHHRNRAAPGSHTTDHHTTELYTVERSLVDGIERVHYQPARRRFDTPLLMQHGMWHGAWCWQDWQELFAEWGWESLAYSLPGHGASPPQRNIAHCTLDYYLGFLKAEVERLPRKPVLMGHSMGGALTQWYLKYVGDLPATVLLGSWVAHSNFAQGLFRFARLIPGVMLVLIPLAWTATPMVGTPERAAKLLLDPEAIISPEELHAKLGPESALVLYQHNPPFWAPPGQIRTPMLWLAAERDAMLAEWEQRKSAAHYNADYVLVEGAGHNLMMAHNYRHTARLIHDWLEKHLLADRNTSW